MNKKWTKYEKKTYVDIARMNGVEVGAKAAGIHPDTMRRWLREDKVIDLEPKPQELTDAQKATMLRAVDRI